MLGRVVKGARRNIDELLGARPGDVGCDAGMAMMHAYVELELRGENPIGPYPGIAIHLASCPGCAADHLGLLEAAREFGNQKPG